MRNSPQDVHKKSLGKYGERQAVRYLKEQGYEILKTNYRTPFGEGKRYIDMARAFLMRAGDVNIRFDVMEVTEEGINHIVSAFEA